MKTLNLAYPERSEIKFKATQFPDSQQQIKISEEKKKNIIKFKRKQNEKNKN